MLASLKLQGIQMANHTKANQTKSEKRDNVALCTYLFILQRTGECLLTESHNKDAKVWGWPAEKNHPVVSVYDGLIDLYGPWSLCQIIVIDF